MINEKRLLEALRTDLKSPDTVTDAEILEKTAGSFTLARVQLGLAMSDFKAALWRGFGLGRTKNEIKARGIIDKALQLNVSLREARDISGISWPCLFDDECRSISHNYPFPWQDIRAVFPKR